MNVLKSLGIGFGLTIWTILGVWASAAMSQRDDLKSFNAFLCFLVWLGMSASAVVYMVIR